MDWLQGQFDRAALVLLRRLLGPPSSEDGAEWESVQHALLVSLSLLAVRAVVLQAVVAVFSSLSFRNPNVSVYRAVARLFSQAFLSQQHEIRSAALSCFRALLESAFRVRESPLFKHVCMLIGECGSDLIQSCCVDGQTHSDEELKILVFIHAIAGAAGLSVLLFLFFDVMETKKGHDVLAILLPAFVSLLESSAQHDAALAVLMTLAQNQAASFKAAASQLAPSRLAVFQTSLKKKADADAKEREVEARKERQRAAAGKIDFSKYKG